ncbi:mitochondrial protein Pet127-domain-containing protein [Aspergillus ambiguus]|uniref:Pet127 family protein n=1 Tax=Aspergillus ambiguus TaxID=176160 RepID=UPI003CCD4FDA
MFRTSLRSVSDPLREHVCFFCLAQRVGAPNVLRNFSSSASRSQSHPKKVEDAASRAIAEGFKSLGKTPPGPTSREKKGRSQDARSQSHDNTKSSAADHDVSAITADQESRGKSRKDTQKSRKVAVKRVRRALSKERRPKRPSKPMPSEVAESQESSARIQSSLQSAVSQLPGEKQSTKSDRENPKNLPFVMGSVHSKDTGSLGTQNLHLKPLDVERPPVPQLSFGLERVLFNPGVYHLRDPRSRVFNFDPYLGSIMPVTEFDFAALKEYITSSKDDTLRDIARKEQKKYMGSSSSMTSVLSHFHYLLSSWRGIDVRTLSQGFPDKLRTFTRLLRSPSAMFLRYQDGVYAIDADKEFDTANILMNLGKSMEKLLTLPKEDFERYRRSSTNKISPEEEQAVPEAYHYSTLGDFIMRSQLDAYDPRLPGTGMFDLKTRAVVSIRMDARNFEQGLGYEIRDRFGAYESYEREFYDMIRAAFLKYSLQVRIGRMDGIFVAFHNIERIFGFQYVSLPEMDLALHGQSDTALGDAEFRLSLALWNKLLDKATEKFPRRSLRLHFETRDAQTPFMYIFAEPVTDDEIQAIQTKNQAEIDAYQRRILNLSHDDDHHHPSSSNDAPAHAIRSHIPDNPSTQFAAITTGDPPQPQPSPATETTDAAAPEPTTDSGKQEPDYSKELLAMTLVVKNKVNGRVVERATDFTAMDRWEVDYEVTELQGKQAYSLYLACQKRREKALAGRGEDETEVANNVYIRRLRDISKQGRKFRQTEEKLDRERGVVVLGGIS